MASQAEIERRYADIVNANYSQDEIDEAWHYAHDRFARRMLREGIRRDGGDWEVAFMDAWRGALTMEEERRWDRTHSLVREKEDHE